MPFHFYTIAFIITQSQIAQDFYFSLSHIDRSVRHENEEMSYHSKMDLTEIYKVFHPRTAADIKFSAMDHILGHKAFLNIYKGIKIIHCITSDCRRIK